MFMQFARTSASLILACAWAGAACSASGSSSDTGRSVNPSRDGDGAEPGAIDPATGQPSSTGDGVVFGDNPVQANPDGDGTINIDDACVTAMADAELVKQPVDIILLLDNSGSMADELQAVEDNINLNFASILASSDVDYRVILLSRHRKDVRTESGEASTSICVTAPLSGLAQCPTPTTPTSVEEPVPGERFFHYSNKIESLDSLRNAIAWYLVPDDNGMPPLGWSQWLRPGAAKVFLEMTDDNAEMDDDDGTAEDPLLNADNFVRQLQTVGAQYFGTDLANPSFKFHSIIGLAERNPPTDPYLPTDPLQTAECTGNANTVENAGETYQVLSQRTGGLRFPLCQFTGYDVVFRRIAEDVIVTSNLACDFAIPAAPGSTTLDLTKVAVAYTKGDGSGTVQFGQAPSLADCQANAFYIAGERINLCPEACTTVRADIQASVDVLFTCQSTIIIK
jgi:hypothetical protein